MTSESTFRLQQKLQIEGLRAEYIDLYNCWHAGNEVPDRLHEAYRRHVSAIAAPFPVEEVDFERGDEQTKRRQL